MKQQGEDDSHKYDEIINRTYGKKPGFYDKLLFLTINIYEKPGFWVRMALVLIN
ncbi:MAG: hypothetical protein F6K40_26185 [Okeania sp. SIO3I5]|uniref:hypothetical protein n=1 Tax=Okeania sp. SIO3I5 TaxID=2607805 RepID=UPI0013B5C2D9|nr:hypothetical protein [Okeania sp. SIO3I5]NEQ39554.1 hypothetical protein [Okeania sp. SIO3I5]